jgi:uncharacterized protein
LIIQRLLHGAKTIAIVGLSPNELRASYFVGYYLKCHGYRVIPVNPREKEILGERSFPSLLEVKVPVDVVNVFRAPAAVAIGAGSLWCQFGVIHEEGARTAHARHWLGFNTREDHLHARRAPSRRRRTWLTAPRIPCSHRTKVG